MAHFCEWGLAGLEAHYAHVSVIVIVDVISFSTAVDIAVARGGEIVPYVFHDEAVAARAAATAGAVLARRREVAGDGFSLSPGSFLRIQRGMKVLLPSPNGSMLSVAGGRDPANIQVLAGCLRNATAVAARARRWPRAAGSR